MTMNFAAALEAMVAGKSVRRPIWSRTNGVSCRLARHPGSEPYIIFDLKSGNTVPYQPTQMDLLATDWEVVPSDPSDQPRYPLGRDRCPVCNETHTSQECRS